ncbi:CMP-N-acetylneuraminate-beta-galactosamide-alpha-2,3-sialyltransferase 4 isoform X2 [Lissotriton helveticus]
MKERFVMFGSTFTSMAHYLLWPVHWIIDQLQRLRSDILEVFTLAPVLRSQILRCGESAIKQASVLSMVCLRGTMATGVLLFMTFSTGTLWYLTLKTHVQPMPYKDDRRIVCSPGSVEAMATAFIENYTRDHQAFLEPSNFFWVKTNSTYTLPFGTRGIEDLLLKVLTITSKYNLPPEMSSKKCKTCVVVGNGNRLQNSSLGHHINKYDVVIRLNNAPVRRYQKDVGNKTTMRFFYPESADFDHSIENNPETLMVLVPFKHLDLLWLKSVVNNEKRQPAKGFWKKPPIMFNVKVDNIRILHPYFMQVTTGKLLNASMIQSSKIIAQKPTSGLLAITFALHFCDVVHIAGFGYPELTNNRTPIHYYEKATLHAMVMSDHNISQETRTIKRLLDYGIIKNLTLF